MQSYMNSLNESAAMETDSSAARDAGPCPEDGNSKEAIGVISRAYRDIFTTGGSREGAAKRADASGPHAALFSHNANFPQAASHPKPCGDYRSCPVAPATLCPVAPDDSQHTFHNVNNNRYTLLASTHQRPPGGSANHNDCHNAGSVQSQLATCPPVLAPGAKVLVRTGGTAADLDTLAMRLL